MGCVWTHNSSVEGAYNPPHTTYGSPQTVSTGGISTSPICSIYSRLRERYASLTRVDPTTISDGESTDVCLNGQAFFTRVRQRCLGRADLRYRR